MIALVSERAKLKDQDGLVFIDFESGADTVQIAVTFHVLMRLHHDAKMIIQAADDRQRDQVLSFREARVSK